MSCKCSKSTLRSIGLCVFYILYLFLGAAVFSAIESSNEKQIIENVKAKRQEFLELHRQCLNESDLEMFIKRIVDANNKGITAVSNLTVEPNWSYGQAVFFAGTVLTTIGYGNISPLSSGGKIFCIIYAIIGIPITLIMISACVERLLIITNKLYDLMKSSSLFVDRSNSTINLKLLTYTHLFLILLFVLVVFFLIPAAIFCSIENDWNYLDALYYCFISLTTIGLGDYIPGDNHDSAFKMIYKIATTFYLIIGVMFVMLAISVFNQIPQLNFAKYFSMKSDEQDDPQRPLLNESSSHQPAYNRQINDAEQPSNGNNNIYKTKP